MVATDALELGIDVGELDAAICVTFPGTVASLRQMWGRAGRRGTGLALYVAGADALDQFFCRHPDEFLERPVESAILDHESEEIHLAHLCAAAYELPLIARRRGVLRRRLGAAAPSGSSSSASCASAAGATCRAARASPRRGSRCAPPRPTRWRSSRRRRGEMIGSVETARARSAVHPGAIYLHMGRSYEVEELDVDDRRALVAPLRRRLLHPAEEGDRHRTSSGRARACARSAEATLSFGTVSVTEQVTAFQRKRVTDHEVLDLIALDMPEEHFVTQALWYELPEQALADDFPLDVLQGSLHAAEHAQIAVLPLIAMCDRWDIGGLSTAFHAQTGRPDGLHLRRPPGRRRDHADGLPSASRSLVRRRAAADRRVPVPRGLPVVRAVAEVRQPQRAAEQERRARAVDTPARLIARGSIPAAHGRHSECMHRSLPVLAVLALATPASAFADTGGTAVPVGGGVLVSDEGGGAVYTPSRARREVAKRKSAKRKAARRRAAKRRAAARARRARPLLSSFSVGARRLYLFGSPATVAFRINARAELRDVRIYVTPAGARKPVSTIRLGARPRGVMQQVGLTGQENGMLPQGEYTVRMGAKDASGRRLRRGVGISSTSAISVLHHAFPIAGPFSWGGKDSRFGARRKGHTHQGQDLAAAQGTPLVAPRGGTIEAVEYQAGGAGHYVVLDATGEDRDYVFMHLRTGSIPVRRGQTVRTGQKIGEVGSTGGSSGPHLHFEVWVGGGWYTGGHPIDPLPLLRAWPR